MFKFWKKDRAPETAADGPLPPAPTPDAEPSTGDKSLSQLFAEHAATRAAQARAESATRDAEDAAAAFAEADAEVAAERASEAAAAAAALAAQQIAPNDGFENFDLQIDAAPGKRSWRERLSGSALSRSLGSLFARKPKLDEVLLEDLETALLTADVGIDATEKLLGSLRQRMRKREFADADGLLAALRAELLALLAPVARPLRIPAEIKPFVVLVVGVNGVGKTTTIGKLARFHQRQQRQVMLAAGDTFRAAAVEQLKAWGARNQVPVIAQGSGADSASVIFDALQAATSRKADLLIADTAGRLHTQSGLMDELSKIKRVLAKLDGAAPHEVLLVIDGTTGQNAVNQVRQFSLAAGVTGLVVTKLDGTAKGGVAFALASEFGLPIRYVGLGEGIDDLREFDPQAFVAGLLPANIGERD